MRLYYGLQPLYYLLGVGCPPNERDRGFRFRQYYRELYVSSATATARDPGLQCSGANFLTAVHKLIWVIPLSLLYRHYRNDKHLNAMFPVLRIIFGGAYFRIRRPAAVGGSHAGRQKRRYIFYNKIISTRRKKK